MAALEEIRAAAEAAARKALAPTEVVEVHVRPETGADGEDLVGITIVVPDAQFDGIDGSRFLSVLLNIKNGVRHVGDERRTIIGYATPSELNDNGDTES